MATEDYWELLHEHTQDEALTKNHFDPKADFSLPWTFHVTVGILTVLLFSLPVLLNEKRECVNTVDGSLLEWLKTGIMYQVYPRSSEDSRSEGNGGFKVLQESSEWWKKAIVYQIYPRSFKDSDGDGIGDIKGIISKLDHFTYLNIDAIWINPFYPSPMLDGGYDVSSFTDVDPVFGTLGDFDMLLRKARERGIRVIIDFVAGHTSSDHPWFRDSVNRVSPYTDFYIWANGTVQEDGTISPPNNWMSTFGHSAWTWRRERQQFYYHAYLPQQPNLNYGNGTVQSFMKEVVRFWMDRGVDGLRVDAVYHLMVSRDKYPDKPRSFAPGFESWQAKYYNNSMTQNIPEIGPIVRDWRKVLDSYTGGGDKYNSKFMVVEVNGPREVRNPYYDYGADFPFNFDLLKAIRTKTCDALCFYENIKQEYESLPEGKWPNFVLSNHDGARASSRLGARFVDALHVLLLTLRGTPTTYYGEEIGMQNVNVSYEDTQDTFGKNYGPDLYTKVSRDPGRSPMQWDDSPNSGFSTASKTWLPVHPDYKTVNVELTTFKATDVWDLYCPFKQRVSKEDFLEADKKETGDPNRGYTYGPRNKDADMTDLFLYNYCATSAFIKMKLFSAQKSSKEMTTLKLYRELSLLRKEPSLSCGSLQFCVVTSNILSYVRSEPHHPAFLVIINLGNETATHDFHVAPVERKTARAKVSTSAACNSGRFVKDRVVSLSSVTLEPGDGLVLELS